ncbi:MAG: hypothetical protein ACI9C4_000337 [Paraglaciecola sp.]|jgi:hypothetical protein
MPLHWVVFYCTGAIKFSHYRLGNSIYRARIGESEKSATLIMGANIGTTATAFIAVCNMDIAAKKTV